MLIITEYALTAARMWGFSLRRGGFGNELPPVFSGEKPGSPACMWISRNADTQARQHVLPHNKKEQPEERDKELKVSKSH